MKVEYKAHKLPKASLTACVEAEGDTPGELLTSSRVKNEPLGKINKMRKILFL